MKFTVLSLLIAVQGALANEPKKIDFLERAPENAAFAFDSKSGKAVPAETPILTSARETRTFVDQANQRIELGPGSSGYFDKDGEFRLLRGSCVLETHQIRKVHSANATFLYRGRALFSFDYKERATSAFVLTGEATLANPHQGSSDQKLARNQGATLVSGDFYPSLLRNLDFTKVDSWLQRYGWSEARRKELTGNIPSSEVAAQLATLEARAADPGRDEKVQRELASFFPVNAEEKGPRKYESEFTTSALTGKPHSAVENSLLRGEEIIFLSPEQAAAIVLPDLGIQPDLRLHFEREEDRVRRRTLPERLPASVKRTPSSAAKPPATKRFAAKQGMEDRGNASVAAEPNPVTSTLQRLDDLERASPQIKEPSPPPAEFRFLEQNF